MRVQDKFQKQLFFAFSSREDPAATVTAGKLKHLVHAHMDIPAVEYRAHLPHIAVGERLQSGVGRASVTAAGIIG